MHQVVAVTQRSAVERPTAAFVLSLLAGIFVLTGGVALGILGAVATFFLAGVGGAFGGFVIGFILGLVGGIFALVFNPKPVGLTSPPRICLKCGAQITDPSVNFCPNCGNDLRISQK